jgi:tetratricopeptide (TPR) repeat protein
VQNQFTGDAQNVVQSRDISGGVHIRIPIPAPLPVPRQLPAEVSHFVSRQAELAEMDRKLAAGTDQPSVMVVSAIAGTAGVGKTALAVRWAHRVRERFPDGELFVDLRGYDAQPPVTPDDALSAFLRALDVAPEKIPVDTQARAAMYRSLLNRRHMLIVLDNAASAAQVRPLLPGTPTCVVVVTSRSRLSGLAIRNGAGLVTLDVLSPDEALLLLRRIVGAERVDADPAAARRLVHLCGRLPLAIRIAGERIGSYPDTPLAEFLLDLEDERARIDALSGDEDDDSAVRSVFSWSYKALREPAARVFRLLGLHAGPHFGTGVVAALSGTSVSAARRQLEQLAGAHLVMCVTRDRYRFHDLLRAYAADLAESDEPAGERELAAGRGLAWYLYGVDATDRVFAPSRRRVPLDLPAPTQPRPAFDSLGAALRWCETEHANLVAAVRQAGEWELDTTAWQLTAVLGEYLFQRKHWADMITTHRIGLDAARRIRDRVGEAWMLTNLGPAHLESEQFGDAVACCEQALAILREIGDRIIEGIALTNLGIALAGLGRLPEAIERQRQALAIHRETGDQWGEAWAMTCLGRALADGTRFGEAADCYRDALRLHDLVGNKWANGSTWTDLGVAHLRSTRFDEATDALTRAIAIHDEADNHWGKATALTTLGDALREGGHLDEAREKWRLALEILLALGAPHSAEVQARLDGDGSDQK